MEGEKSPVSRLFLIYFQCLKHARSMVFTICGMESNINAYLACQEHCQDREKHSISSPCSDFNVAIFFF